MVGYSPWGCKMSDTTEQLRFAFWRGHKHCPLLSFFFFFWQCGIVVPWSGIKPVPPALGVQSLNHWTATEVPIAVFIWERCHLCFTKFSKPCSTRREYCAFKSFKIPLISSVQLELCVRTVFPISTSLPLLKMWEGVDNEETGERGDEQLQQKSLTST